MTRRKTQRDRILSYIKRRPASGATRRELTRKLHILHQSVGPRVVELIDARLVKESKEYRDGCRVLIPTGKVR